MSARGMRGRGPLRSLHGRLATVLLVLLVTVGAFGLVSTQVTARWHRQEAGQAVHLDLAANIAKSEHGRLIAEDGTVDREELTQIFHWMMVINPGLQFYLLDAHGRVLAYDTMPGPIVQQRVDLEPIRALLERPGDLPVLGEDPRHPSRRKIFSVAPLDSVGGERQGYLYIVLDNAPFESLLDSLRGNNSLQMGLLAVGLSLVLSTLFGIFFFGRLTRPLRRLSAQMRSFREGRPAELEARPARGEDELAELKVSFEDMVARIRAQMEEIDRLAEMRSELIANVSHDLRTPISMIQGYLETLRFKSVEPEEREQYLGIAWKQSSRLAKLVDELFELTKLDADEVKVERESFSISELVQDNAQHFEMAARERGVELRTHIDGDLQIEADIGLVERALQNLIENALRYTPQGGRVTVGVRLAGEGELEVFVRDTGCGIEPSKLPGVFDRYYRSKGSARGSGGLGLGLAITRKIAHLHGGEADVESRPGEGATFRLRLPRTGLAGAEPSGFVAVPSAAAVRGELQRPA